MKYISAAQSLPSESKNREFTYHPGGPASLLDRSRQAPLPHSIGAPPPPPQPTRASPHIGTIRSTALGTMNQSKSGPIKPGKISPQYTVSRPEPEPSTSRKTSVADLIGRLTTPTVSSRQKMKSPTRNVSGGNQSLRSPKPSSSGKRSVSHNDVIISRPIPLPKQLNPTGRSLSINSPDVQLASRRKAPSPPKPELESKSAPQSVGKMRSVSDRSIGGFVGNGNQEADSSTDSFKSFKNYSTPKLESPSRFNSPDSQVKKTPKLGGTENPETPLSAGALKMKVNTTMSPSVPKSTPKSASKSAAKSTNPTPPIESSPSETIHNTKILPLNIHQPANTRPKHLDMTASSYLGHRRRLSAPAPAVNITTPRAMSQASNFKGRVVSPPISPNSVSKVESKPYSANGSIASYSSYDEAKTPLSSLSPSPETKSSEIDGTRNREEGASSTDTLRSSHNRTKKTAHFSLSEEQSLPEEQSLSEEQSHLRDQNKKLKLANKMLKAKLEELLNLQDQAAAELAICQASKNSLEQQVKGYDSVQRGMEKTVETYRRELAKSRSREGQLRTHVQELKISLEEKNIENYALSRQRTKNDNGSTSS